MKKELFVIAMIIIFLNPIYASGNSNISHTGTLPENGISASAGLVWEIKNSSIVSIYFSDNPGNDETNPADIISEFELTRGDSLIVTKNFYLIYSVRGNANAKLSIKANGAMTTSGSGKVEWGIYKEDGSLVSGWDSAKPYEYAELGDYNGEGNIPLQIRTENLEGANIVVGSEDYVSSMGVKIEIV